MKRIFFLLLSTLVVASMLAQTPTRKTMQWRDTTREWLELTPAGYDATQPTPVLFCFHGMGDTMRHFAAEINAAQIANNYHWIVVVPQALIAKAKVTIMVPRTIPLGTIWAGNVGCDSVDITYESYTIQVPQTNLNENIDDVGFVGKILDTLQTYYSVNTDSVFALGFSMGGFLCHRLAIEAGSRFTAVAAVSGTIGHFQEFNPTTPINIMHIHGTVDSIVGYADGNCNMYGFNIGSIGTGAEETVAKWRDFNHCSDSTVFDYPDTQTDGLTFQQTLYEHGQDNSRVAFIKVQNGEHGWYSKPRNDIDYIEEIYKFFTGQRNATGLKTVTHATSTVWPTRSSDIVNVKIDSPKALLHVYNVLGVEMSTQILDNGLNVVNISRLRSGIYVFRIVEAGKVTDFKVVRE